MTDTDIKVPKPIDDRDRGRMAGIAPVKAEYLIPADTTILVRSAPDDDAAEAAKDCRSGGDEKRQKTKGGWKARTKGQKPLLTGERSVRMCSGWEKTGKCPFGDQCKYAHSWDAYFAVKPVDIHYVRGTLSDEVTERVVGGEDPIGTKIDLATTCPVFAELGYCTFGWRCRFLGGHVKRAEGEEDNLTRVGGWELLGFPDMEGSREGRNAEVNWAKIDVLSSLQKSKYEYEFSPKYLAVVEPNKTFGRKPKKQPKKKRGPVNEEDAMNGEAEVTVQAPTEEEAMNEEEAANGEANGEQKGFVPGQAEAMDVPLRPEEKRRLNWDNGLYLAPLTTVGNLPFRRVCTDYGATITISEMALAEQIVQGKNEEWALVRRHESEKMFGVQLAGGWPNRMVPAAEVLARELGPSGIDFVDINMGCPIDLLFKQGAGSALMDNARRLGKICVGMNRALGEIPLTVKFRTGVANNHPIAHKLIPRFANEWGASAMTLHGRSRQQRYTKLADWAYIRKCVDVLRESTADAGLPPIPIFGNGDCYSAQSYWEEKEASGVDGVMVARGALIKPWLFTEIAERREWDISATERLEGIRKFAEYGLSHWGADTQGVNTTRRFLCEALSFQSRYIPIGLLERLPPMLNERPPAYRGRNELETLLGSSFVGDWVKISEMFLGPAGDDFNFQPKHKSNAYGSEEAQDPNILPIGNHRTPSPLKYPDISRPWYRLLSVIRTQGRWPRPGELTLNPDREADVRQFGSLGLINLHGKTVEMLGYGHIEGGAARLLHAFGCQILAANTASKKSGCHGYIIPGKGDVEGDIPTAWYSTQDPSSFKTFLSRSDILVGSLPSTPATRGMLTREHLAQLPPRALFINVRPGDLVFSDAILAALDAENGLFGAGLDVTDPEPLPAGHALFTHPRAVITPHSSADVEGYYDAGGELRVENIENMRRGGTPYNVVDPVKGY